MPLIPFCFSSNRNLSRAIFTAIFSSSFTQISRCVLDVFDGPVAAIFDFVGHTLLQRTSRIYRALTTKAQFYLPTLSSLQGEKCSGPRENLYGRLVLVWNWLVYVVLLQEEVINKMKRKTEATEDSVEVDNTSRKVKQSPKECNC